MLKRVQHDNDRVQKCELLPLFLSLVLDDLL